MPRQSKTKINAAQAKNARNAAKALQKATEQRRKEVERNRKKFIRETDKHLKSIAKKIEGLGIYEPKSLDMTPYRRKRLRKVERDYAQYLDDNKYFRIKVPKADRKHVIQRAESLKLEHSRSGIFVPREGHKRAALKKSKSGEVYIERSGKTKRGVNKGRHYKSHTPLASLDELDRQRERIRKAVKRLGKFDDKNRLHFVVLENGTEGAGRFSFDNFEDLMAYLDGYNKSDAARINFYRHIHVMKVTQQEFDAKYPPKDRGKPYNINERRKSNRKPGKHDTRGSK